MADTVIINLENKKITSIEIQGPRPAKIDLAIERPIAGLDRLIIDSAAGLALTAALLIDVIQTLDIKD